MSIIDALIAAALYECCAPDLVSLVCQSAAIRSAACLLDSDIHAYMRKDPATRNDYWLVSHACSSFRAVLHYRVARALAEIAAAADPFRAVELAGAAALVSCRGKLLSGADINFSARIGSRFVLDHGYGTVIGETTEIGDDCYVLGGVTLGAMGIAGNVSMKRHPSVGNRVQIGAFARVLGAVSIGDDVFIGSHCTITEDVPSHTRVTVKSTMQVTRLSQVNADPRQAPMLHV